jgi:hypothetical protein
MQYRDQKQHSAIFLALTSLTVLEFEYLLHAFSFEWEKYYKYHTLTGQKRRLPAFAEHGNSLLKGTDQKLFFLVVYLKNNPLQTFQAASFGLSQAAVSKIYRVLLAVLDQTLARLKLAPCRDAAALKTALSKQKKCVFWLDGTETPLPRNKDQESQKEEFSGKKRGHRLKNLTVCDATQYIHYLSSTEPGSMHDKALADLDPLLLPAGCVLKQDLGFLGHSPAGVNIEMPFKKSKNKPLTFSQKLYNQLLSKTRVIIEHANSGLKRLRMLQEVCRVRTEWVRDRLRVVACGLHNLRVAGIDEKRRYNTSSRLLAYVQHQV